mgnify:CR=1 FL=1
MPQIPILPMNNEELRFSEQLAQLRLAFIQENYQTLARMFHTFFHHRAPLCMPRWPAGYRSVRLPEAPSTRPRARDESFGCIHAG